MYQNKHNSIQSSDSAYSHADCSCVDGHRAHMQHQVNDLCNDLCEGDHTMSENATLMSHFQTSLQNRSAEVDELKRELDRSNELLSRQNKSVSDNAKCIHVCACTSLNCSSDQATHECVCRQKVMNDLERERLARERNDIEKSHVMDLRNSSVKGTYSAALTGGAGYAPTHPNEHVCNLTAELTSLRNEVHVRNESNRTEGQLKELAQEIKLLKADMWKKGVNGRQKQLLKELKSLESKLISDRQQHSSVCHTAKELASLVCKLRKELCHVQDDKRKAFLDHEATTHQLTAGKESLVKQVDELRQQLKMSEESRLLSEQKYLNLSEKCDQQEREQHLVREKVQDVETKLFDYQKDRNVLLKKFNKVNALLVASRKTETELREHCHELQAQVMDKSIQDEALRRKVADTEKECSESKLEVSQLRDDLCTAEFKKNEFLQKITVLESQISQSESECALLREHARELSLQLQSSEQERALLMEHEACALDTVKDLEEKKQLMNVAVSDLEKKLEQQSTMFSDSQSQAEQTLRKYRAHCKHLTQEKQRATLSMEQMEATCRCEDLQRQLLVCQSTVENGDNRMQVLIKENEDLKIRVQKLRQKSKYFEDKYQQLEALAGELRSSLEASKLSFEKCQEESVKLLSDNETLALEITSLRQDLTRAVEETNTHVTQLEKLESHHRSDNARMESSNISLRNQLEKLTTACKFHKAKVSSVQAKDSVLRHEKNQLQDQLKQVQQSFFQREEELTKEIDTIQVSHRQEVDKLVHEHSRIISSLHMKAAELQVKLTDKRSALQVVRKQQFKALDNQQRNIEEELSRSLSDSEKVKHKYLITKKHYQEKMALLEEKLTVSKSEERADLHQLLSRKESQISHVCEEHQTLVKVLTVEMDVLVDMLSRRVDIPEFPGVGFGQDTRRCASEILAKFQWMKKEVVDLIMHEEKLRKLLHVQETYSELNSCRACKERV